ncbi:MAG: DUF4956 domain-containing protein [Planctomycetes bacterium]|nr:DUF4956 domain-containing protein [Planctomycetota bacterium]
MLALVLPPALVPVASLLALAPQEERGLFSSLQPADPVGLVDNLFNLAVGLVLCTLLVLALVQTYRATHRGAIYSATFLQALFVLAACTTLIMLVIGNEIARAFSLVGALSIVRFRTAIKDPRDVGFVFAALALGMACGTGFYYQAILFTVFLCGLLLALTRMNVGRAESNEAIVRVTADASGSDGTGSDGTMADLEAALKSAGAQPVLINRILEGNEQQTLAWRVRTGGAAEQGQLQTRLRGLRGVRTVGVYVMDDFHVL